MPFLPLEGRYTVLVVADGNELSLSIEQSLRPHLKLHLARDSEEALQKAGAEKPDLIILDIDATQARGLDMVSAIRQQRPLDAIPILVVSTTDSAEDKNQLLLLGVQGFLTKPLSSIELKIQIQNLLQLKVAHERYTTLLNSMDQGFCTVEVIFDADNQPVDFRFLEINDAFEKQSGISHATGKRMRELAPNHERYWFDYFGSIALTGQSMRFENWAHALGRWYEVYAFPLGEPAKHQVAIFFSDISQRKVHDDALQENAQRLSLALAAGELGDWRWDAATDIVTLSPRAAAIFGLPVAPITWAQMRELLHPDDREMARVAVEQALANRSDYKVEYRISRDGQQVWIAARGRGTYELQHVTGMTGIVQDVTAQREMQEALRESEEKLRATFNQAATGMAISGMDGRFEQVNARFSQILGYTPEELCRFTFRDITHPDDVALSETYMHRLLADEIKDFRVEKRYLRKDGALVWSMTSVTLMRDKTGQPFRFIGSIEDITRRKEAEEGLRRSEIELRALANSIPQLAWIADRSGDIFWYNQRWYEYTGSNLEEMRGWGWEKVHHPEHLPRVLPIWQQALATGQPWEDTFPLRSASGEYRWFLSRAFPIRDGNGEITRWFGTNTDVEDVRQTQEMLRDESRILELLYETGTAIASELNLERLVQTVTDAATELTGAKFGAFFYNTINEEGEALVLYTLSGAPRSAFERFGLPRNTPVFNPTFNGEGVVRSDDITQDPRYGKMAPHHGMPVGHLPVCSYLAVPVISRSGGTIGGLFFGHPEPGVFTERAERLIVGVAAQAAIGIDNAQLYEARKKAQDALQQAHEQLELRVAERTARLSEAVAQMEEFSYTVSHDLRAPLRGMQAYSQALLEECSELLASHPHAVEYLQRIADNAHRLDRMALDVLTFSRVTRGELKLGRVDLDKLVRDLVEHYASMQAPGADIRIDPLLPVTGHEPSLTQIMSNLLSNAIKFVPVGEIPKIHVWTEQRGHEVRIWVEDSGLGIDPRYQHRLFRMFERIHPDSNYHGTGVGLAVVRKAAERMHGTVGVESDGKTGSRFWVQLGGV